jgi:hypothetical protein
MTDIKITSGKYAGRFISDVCKDRRYMNWIMTTWDHSSTIPKAIKNYIEAQKTFIKTKYASTTDPNFVKEWLSTSYEGYKILPEDIEWVQKLLNTTSKDITLGFLRSEYVFKVGDEEFALRPMVVNERKDTFGAFRNEIQEQIKNFKDNSFRRHDRVRCEETGMYMRQNTDVHVDHHFRKKTFNQLVEEFLSKEEADFTDIAIENCGMFYRLKDRSLAERWNEYHKEHAILRLIHVSANTNAEFYLSKYKEPPFEPKEIKKKVEKIPDPIIMTFDMLPKHS